MIVFVPMAQDVFEKLFDLLFEIIFDLSVVGFTEKVLKLG